MAYPLTRIVGLVGTAAAHYLSTTPPLPSAGPTDNVYKNQSFEHTVFAVRIISKTFLCFTLLSEAAFVASVAFPGFSSILGSTFPNVRAVLCPYPQGDITTVQNITSLFVIGVSFAIVGAIIRVWTYRVLGPLFTYEVTVRPKHTLITRAPYNIVRHPSYTGLFVHMAGILCTLYSQRGWDDKCHISSAIMGSFTPAWPALWIFLSTYTYTSVWRRGAVEDDLMLAKFGDSWRDYYRRVPYKFIPGLA